MAFEGLNNFNHQQQDKIGVIVTNLGTPRAPNTKALRAYLREFLSDPRVVEIPRLLWLLILHGIILRVRPSKSAAAYQSVWTSEGSPLLINTKNQAVAIRQRAQESHGEHILVDYAMRYGSPSIEDVVGSMLESGARKILILPLYPQYSGSTTGSTFDAVAKSLMKKRWVPELRFVNSYHKHPLYIRAMANKIRDHWQEHGKADKLILSYHGVPKRYLESGDPYYCHCHATSRLLIDELRLDQDEVITSFQSRFGKAEWLKPYTDQTLKSLPSQGCKTVQVFCPGFSSDCLETIEEIAVENRDYFLEAGGESYQYITALNAEPDHIEALMNIIHANIVGWESKPEDLSMRQKRYEASPIYKSGY